MDDSKDTDKKIELLIDKLRLDVGKDNALDARTLSVENTRKEEAKEEPAKDIDQQIADLEDMIKKLQEELAGMSKSDQKLDEENLSTKEDSSSNKVDIEGMDPEIPCITFPVIIQDGVTLEDAKEKFTGEVAKLMSYQGTSDTIPESFSTIRTSFSALWCDQDPKDDHLDDLISELKAEISEKLETLKDVDTGQTLNNSLENIP